MSTQRRIVILGGGICGLSAAWKLLEADPKLKVTVLEQEPRAGGLARSLTVDGQVTDLGPHRIFTELPDVQEFLHELAGDELKPVKRSSRMFLKGGWIEYPPQPVEIMKHLGVTTLAGAGTSYALHKAKNLFASGQGKQESFRSLMVDAFGPDLYNLLVGPYAEKVWKVPPSKIHGDIARVRVSAGGLDQVVKKLLFGEKKDQITAVKKFHYIAGGVENLIKKLKAGVQERGGKIQVVREVVDVEPLEDETYRVHAKNLKTGKVLPCRAERVISTIPINHLLGMLLKHREEKKAEKTKNELRYIANFLVCLVVNKPQVTDAQWLYFPEKGTVFNRGYEPKNFHRSMGSRDKGMIVMEITCHENDQIWKKSDRQLLNATIKGCEKAGILNRGQVVNSLVHRIPYTYPLYDLEYRQRMKTLIGYLKTFPNLVSVGRQGLFLHNNMDHSMHMGFEVAKTVLNEDKDPAQSFYDNLRRFQTFRIVD